MFSYRRFCNRRVIKVYSCGKPIKKIHLIFTVFLFFQALGCEAITSEENIGVPVSAAGTFEACNFGEAIESDGYRRLALIIGVGRYKNNNVPDLEGPPNDANRFYQLITEENGYGFPVENVCLLLNEEATTANFKQAFDKALVERAQENDVVVIFFAGHGSQAPDTNGDEVDGFDETLMFHDARTGKVKDLVDDEFNRMLVRLHKKTSRITVILDSCNAGTAIRGPEASTVKARYFTPLTVPIDDTQDGDDVTEMSSKGMVNESLPGLVFFAAAADSHPALEKNGRGIFTDSLLNVMMEVQDRPLTYAQVARMAPPLVSAESFQVPYFHGDLERAVFGNQSRTRPVSWEVKKAEEPIEIAGPPLAGIGEGAEFRIYDGSVTGADTRDPNKAKATLVVIESYDLNARAVVSAANPNMPQIKPRGSGSTGQAGR
jgi:hypothetical protein